MDFKTRSIQDESSIKFILINSVQVLVNSENLENPGTVGRTEKYKSESSLFNRVMGSVSFLGSLSYRRFLVGILFVVKVLVVCDSTTLNHTPLMERR